MTKIFRQIRTKIFGQITQLSKGPIIPSLTDRVDSRVLPKWAELKKDLKSEDLQVPKATIL